MKKIFIGFDTSQKISYDVLVHSIRKHARSSDYEIHPLVLKDLEAASGFRRPWDPLQSTEFTYTRFLVPWLSGYRGIALFMDSDMLALGNLLELFELDMGPYALRVVKHDYTPQEGLKMGKLGKVQQPYPRKNWSSLMLMDCAKLRCWTKEAVETQPAAWLHRFLPVPDVEIGELDGKVWNVLDRYDEATKLVHYTSGGPWTSYFDVWYEYKHEMEAGLATRKPPGRIVAWHSGAGNNEMLVSAAEQGLRARGTPVEPRHVSLWGGKPEPSISYGVLRGIGPIYRRCEEAGVDWWNIDHGFFHRSNHRSGRFDGHYRIGYRDLMPLFRPGVRSDPCRWEKLGLAVQPWRKNTGGPVILCPPTDAMGEYYGVDPKRWAEKAARRFPEPFRSRIVLRTKTDADPLGESLANAAIVAVYNSNVAIEALLDGVPAVAERGAVRSWNGLSFERAEEAVKSPERFDREEFFSYLASCQYTIDEMRSGLAWKLLSRSLGQAG